MGRKISTRQRSFNFPFIIILLLIQLSCGGGGGSSSQGEGGGNDVSTELLAGIYELSAFKYEYSDGTILNQDDYDNYYGRLVMTTDGYAAMTLSLNYLEADLGYDKIISIDEGVMHLYNDCESEYSDTEFTYDGQELKLILIEGTGESEEIDTLVWKKTSDVKYNTKIPVLVDVIYYRIDGTQHYRTSSFKVGEPLYREIVVLDTDCDVQSLLIKRFYPSTANNPYEDPEESALPKSDCIGTYYYPANNIAIKGPAGDWRFEISVRDSKNNYSNVMNIYFEVRR